MRSLSQLAAIVMVTLAAGCASSGGKSAPMTVMTYNIHHGAGMDKEVDLPRIAALIKKFNPDFVAIQEVDVNTNRTGHIDQPAELGKLTGMHPIFGRAMDYDGGQYGVMILSRTVAIDHRIIELPYTHEGKHEPRVALVGHFHTAAGDMLFISTHLDFVGSNSDRLTQVTTISDALREDIDPMVLAGDFNCEPASPPIGVLLKTWNVASSGDPSPTEPSVNPTVKIDHVLINPASRWIIGDAHVIDNQVASDHRPVVVELELKPAPKW